MEAKLYQKFIFGLDSLSTEQYKGLKKNLKNHDNKKRNALSLQRTNQSICPHCQSEDFIQWGVRNDLQRYKCKKCTKTFNTLTSTPLARLRKKGRWLEYSRCLKAGKSVRKSAVLCGVHRNTSFKWRHRFLENSKQIETPKLRGIVEFEVTYFKYSEKGQKRRMKSSEKSSRWNQNKPRVCVLIGRDRNKNTLDRILKKLNKNEIERSISSKLHHDILFCSDSKSAYTNFTKSKSIRHGKINKSKGIHKVKDIVHVQNAGLYQMRLKEWMVRFRGVATKYLDSYLSWFRELDEYNMEIPAIELLLRAKMVKPYSHQP